MSAATAIATRNKTSELQRALYRAAKDSPARKFHVLFDKVHRRDVLERAWEEVARNRGAPGVDGTTIEEIEGFGVSEFLDGLASDLADGRWRPMPVRRLAIPKPDGGFRNLGIPSVRDRVVQAALKIVCEPIFEADFSPASFGFRPKRSAHQALNTIMDAVWAGGHQVVEADIASFFDEVDHAILMTAISERIVDRKVLKAFGALLRSGALDGESLLHPDTGTPQGGVVSPLLANVYLNRLDRSWELRHGQLGKLIRYADDQVIICKTKARAKSALAAFEEELGRLGLRTNPSKTAVIDLDAGGSFDFLGFHHRWVAAPRHPGVWFLARWPSRQVVTRVRQRVRIITARDRLHVPVEVIVENLNRFLRGWGAYFRHGNSAETFDKLDGFIADRLVLFISKKHQRAVVRSPCLGGLAESSWSATNGRSSCGCETESLAGEGCR